MTKKEKVGILKELRKNTYKRLTEKSIKALCGITKLSRKEVMSYKFCSSCGEFLHIDKFSLERSKSKDGHASICKKCASLKQKDKFYIYFHLYNKKVIYVGLTTTMKQRQAQHLKKSEHAPFIEEILYVRVKNRTLMNIYEEYYINKYSPEYNVKMNRGDDVSELNVKELEFKKYTSLEQKVSLFQNGIEIKNYSLKPFTSFTYTKNKLILFNKNTELIRTYDLPKQENIYTVLGESNVKFIEKGEFLEFFMTLNQ